MPKQIKQEECEIRWCRARVSNLMCVNENIGDGAWRVGICQECANRLGLKSGDDLPEAHIVMSKIRRTNEQD